MRKIVITKNTLRLLVKMNKHGEQVFKAIVMHPMETGQRRDHRTGKDIPAEFIEDFRVSVDGATIFELTMGPEVSKNPYTSFVFSRPLVDNQHMRVSWVENNGKETFYDCVVKFGNNAAFQFSGDSKATRVYRDVPKITHRVNPYCKQKSPAAGQ
ncbi:MAG: thiosulfate oxidation carrier complex protein SoxZ [Thioalkalispiraceae bacterium]|jgi:sulfur-oxidizing protein SoxZ